MEKINLDAGLMYSAMLYPKSGLFDCSFSSGRQIVMVDKVDNIVWSIGNNPDRTIELLSVNNEPKLEEIGQTVNGVSENFVLKLMAISLNKEKYLDVEP